MWGIFFTLLRMKNSRQNHISIILADISINCSDDKSNNYRFFILGVVSIKYYLIHSPTHSFALSVSPSRYAGCHAEFQFDWQKYLQTLQPYSITKCPCYAVLFCSFSSRWLCAFFLVQFFSLLLLGMSGVHRQISIKKNTNTVSIAFGCHRENNCQLNVCLVLFGL